MKKKTNIDNRVSQLILNEIRSFRIENKKDHEKINERLDMIGSSVAFLEDDTPTRKEFDNLERRVAKVEASL